MGKAKKPAGPAEIPQPDRNPEITPDLPERPEIPEEEPAFEPERAPEVEPEKVPEVEPEKEPEIQPDIEPGKSSPALV